MADVNGTLPTGHIMPGRIICATMEILSSVAETRYMLKVMIREFDDTLKFSLFYFKGN